MSLRRENDFPATSIGRTSGVRLQSAAAALDTHPLLSPRPSSPAPSEHGSIAGSVGSLNSNTSPRYVPYTPRQRVTPTAATTGTTVHPTSPQHQSGDATSKLQLMHLKAAAQTIGLDSGTLGWAILEKLVIDPTASEEWNEVWNAIASGKTTLLLPLESAFTHEKITADFVKDHLVLCDGPSRRSAPIVTLSGIRGTLEEETLTFRSTVNPSSKIFQDLLNPTTRTAALSLLPPLPHPFPEIQPAQYPQFQVPSHTSSLHIPPRFQNSKPPLPPRPGTRANGTPGTSTPRIGNPFASLFGGAKAAAQPVPASPPSSLHSIDSAQDTTAPVEVSAFAIDRRIVRKDIGKAINKALKGEVKAALKSPAVPVPYWVAERVHDLTIDWYPFVKAPLMTPTKKKLSPDKHAKESGGGFVVNAIDENLDDTADRLQDFFGALEQDIRAAGVTSRAKRKESESDVEDEKEKEQHSKMENDARIREIMEVVERTITWLFYDRLFKQPSTDDASHDEALSNRIAALNMLDLGLGHLGIDIGEINESELNSVVRACGDILTQLDSCRSPGDKSAILVAAHKIVVDGLSRLPPIQLTSETDNTSARKQDDLQTAKPATKGSDATVAEQAADTQPATATSTASSDTTPDSSVLFSPPPGLDTSPSPQSEEKTPVSVENPPQPPLNPASKVKAPPPPLPLDESKLEVHAPLKEPTPVSGDVLLPIIIFSVVKANPPHLVSNLLFIQRFRNHSVGGEESYCLINLMAVAEFLENVDMAALGLGDSDKVLSTADLTPIPLTRSPVTAETPLAPADGLAGRLRGSVGQQVDAIADSANKVIGGVVDSSFGILRSFMPGVNQAAGTASGRTTPSTPGKTGFGLLRREAGFSIANLAASLPMAGRSRSGLNAEESGQQLVSVSRPSSIRSRSSLKIRVGGEGEESQEDEDDEDESSDSSDEESEEGKEDGDGLPDEAEGGGKHDVRSIRSFESMLSASKEKHKANSGTSVRPRKTLSDRLASVSALASSSINKASGPSSPSSRPSSLHIPQPRPKSTASPTSSRPASPVLQAPLRLAPPKQRFIECTPDDLRLSEVGELLRDYRRLVEGIRAAGGFED